MSPAFEAFLAQLYVDRVARQRFLDDPEAETLRAQLGAAEREAVCRIDRVGLALAAASFERKRATTAPHQPFLRRVTRALRQASARLRL